MLGRSYKSVSAHVMTLKTAAERAEAKRKKPRCGSCRYRTRICGMVGCDYIGIAGQSRGCSVEDCDKYERGRPARSRLDEEEATA